MAARDKILRWEDLLDQLHQQYTNHEIITDCLQIPNEENKYVAIFKCSVKVVRGEGDNAQTRVFQGHGDASPRNVSEQIRPHFFRMAESRSKVRAVRDAVNAHGELADDKSTLSEREMDSSSAPPAKASGTTPHPDNVNGVQKGAAAAPQQFYSVKSEQSGRELLKQLAIEFDQEKGLELLEVKAGVPLTQMNRGQLGNSISRVAEYLGYKLPDIRMSEEQIISKGVVKEPAEEQQEEPALPDSSADFDVPF